MYIKQVFENIQLFLNAIWYNDINRKKMYRFDLSFALPI